MSQGIPQPAARSLPGVRSPDYGRHLPASHPVLRRGLKPVTVAERIRAHSLRRAGEALASPASRAAEPGPLASPQAHGLGYRAYQEDLVTHVEHLVRVIADTEMPLSLFERYERALHDGHANNLRRLSRLKKE